MNSNERVLELLRRAVAILEDECEEHPEADPSHIAIQLEGTIARPELKTVGEHSIALYTAGLKTRRNHDGRVEWVNIQAWRATALWANENIQAGDHVKVYGSFETNEWTTKEGETRQQTVFNARAIEAA